MPHIVLETTADLVENALVPDILGTLVAKLASFESIDSKSIKGYHTLRSVWAMGEGAPTGFVHCTVAILRGRSDTLRQEIADGMYQVLLEQFAESKSAGEANPTLELREMDALTYRK